MKESIDIPIISTIASINDDYRGKIAAGVSILNISGGANTASIVRQIRSEYGKDLPIIATGGPTEETILETIEAGANAITYTPPTSGKIFADIMSRYRNDEGY